MNAAALALLIHSLAAASFSPYLPSIEAALECVDESAFTPVDLNKVNFRYIPKCRFQMPVRAQATLDMMRAPDEPRPYRHGTHQGSDIYGLPYGEPVYPIAPGVVLRVDRAYVPMKTEYRQKLLERCRETQATPGGEGAPEDPDYGDILDALRGRQVWIYHGRNERGEAAVSIYAHLSAVAQIQPLQPVDADTVIGHVGHSGTSHENKAEHWTPETHLHFELYIGGRYWRPLRLGKKPSAERIEAARRQVLLTFAPVRANP